MMSFCSPAAGASSFPIVALDVSSVQSQRGRILFSRLEDALERIGLFVWVPRRIGNSEFESKLFEAGAEIIVRLNERTSTKELNVKILTASPSTPHALSVPDRQDLTTAAIEIARVINISIKGSTNTAKSFPKFLKTKPALFLKQMDEGYQELLNGRLRRAEYRFERALELTSTGIEPEALGAMLDVRGLSNKFDAELARSAVQTALVSEKQKKHRDALRQWVTFLKFNPHHVRPFNIHWPLGNKQISVLKSDANTLWINHQDALLKINVETGGFSQTGSGNQDLVLVLGKTFVLRKNNGLIRVDQDSGKILWRSNLPGLKRDEKILVDSVSGILAVATASKLFWLDGTSGEIIHALTTPNGVTLGQYGAITQTETKKGTRISLYRPGRNAPAWERIFSEKPRHIALTGERVIIQGSGKANILDARNGKTRGETLRLERINTAPISTGLRYVAWAEGNNVHIYDVLAVTKAATALGPSKPVAALVRQNGIVVAFESSDVIHFDRDGTMQARTLVPGRVHALTSGSPRRPMQILVTSLGLFALGEPVSNLEHSDFDAYLALARLLLAQGEKKLAIDMLTELASQNAGNIVQIAIELCRSLSETGEIAKSHQRALDAGKSTQTLQPFSFF
ncbi:MAG: hypothetical protein VYC39_05650 [Myxococcota bacterium]|nr:hypothetical protein [Myxococcota bacterium]